MKKKRGRKTRAELFADSMEDFPDELLSGYRLAVLKRIESLSLEDFRIWWSFLIRKKLDLIVDDIEEVKQISVAGIVKAARQRLKDEENKSRAGMCEERSASAGTIASPPFSEKGR